MFCHHFRYWAAFIAREFRITILSQSRPPKLRLISTSPMFPDEIIGESSNDIARFQINKLEMPMIVSIRKSHLPFSRMRMDYLKIYTHRDCSSTRINVIRHLEAPWTGHIDSFQWTASSSYLSISDRELLDRRKLTLFCWLSSIVELLRWWHRG